MSGPRQKDNRFPDRVLGSSWSRWDGNVDAHEAALDERPGLYFGMLGLMLLVFTLVLGLDGWVLWRLVFAGHVLALIAVCAVIGLPLATWWFSYALCALVVATRRRLFARRWLPRWLTLQIPFLALCGKAVGISGDRVASSCIAITNRVTRLRLRSESGARVMVLLPRCLRRDVINEVRQLAAAWGVPVVVAGRNVVARQRVKEYGPSALVAVACERDLVGGLYDYGHKLPILVVPNHRWHGPCLNATLDIGQLRQALEDILGPAPEEAEKPDADGSAQKSAPEEKNPDEESAAHV